MDIIQGAGKTKIAGAKVGDLVWIHLITGKVEKVLLNDITRLGIEGFEVDLNTRPLTFYPFTAIIKIKKFTETQ